MNDTTTLITGGTGFVGGYLLPKLSQKILTTRNVERAKQKAADPDCRFLSFDGELSIDPKTRIDAIVNLMGESIADGRWTAAKKDRLRTSRVEATRKLVDQIIQLEQKPKVLVSASAVGIYGDPGEVEVDEKFPAADDFLAQLCVDWEHEARRLVDHGVRVVQLRIGIVLGKGGGAAEKLLPLFKLGLGGPLGDGKHYVPWIHVEDLVSMIVWAIENESVSGALNGTAPHPVRNSEMTRAMAKALGRFAILPAPKFALRIVLGEFANSLFSSQRVIPKAALEGGFQFQYPTIESAMAEIVSSSPFAPRL